MMNYIKKSHLALFSSVVMSLCAFQVNANTWTLDNLVSRSTEQSVPYFFYVGQGERWQDIQFKSQFDTYGNSTVVVRYDNQIIYKQNLNGQGELSFALPPSSAGFHRLDFLVLQQPLGLAQESKNLCLESSTLYTALTQPNLTYQTERGALQLNQLPDALFNSQLSRPAPIQALLHFNSSSYLESSMIARLANAWNFATPVEWKMLDNPQQSPDFSINIQRVTQPTPAAKISIDQVNQIPSLNIEYSSESQLLMAVNALLNSDYLQQLNTATATINGPVAEPTWATPRKFETLADFGIADFTVENWPKSIAVIFPAVWEATDVLKGQLAFRSQSGLLQGSTLQVWLNDALAGSFSLAKLDSNPIERQFEFVSADYPYTTNYNMRLNSSQLNNEVCLPNAGGALWINSSKSVLTLSHRMKEGVINLSNSFVNNPEIAINNVAGTSIAISLANVAKKMLLTDHPIALNITPLDLKNPKAINVVVDANQFKKDLQKYAQTLYLPSTNHGFLVTIKDGKFWINTDDAAGTETFVRYWPEIQQQIPTNTAVLFVSAQGNLTVLQHSAVHHDETPLVEQISIRTIALILALIVIVILSLLIWRRNRKNKADNV